MSKQPSPSEVLEVLEHGSLETLGLLPYSSNYTFLARACLAGVEIKTVYKPRRGERPLWDFRRGTLAAREVAAFLVSEAGGFNVVPPTVMRTDAPMGEGSVQQFIAHDPERHYFVLVEERLNDFPELAAFDIVINNADRKAGHVIEDAEGKLWAVDHGLTFNVEDKLRTVIWEFAGASLGGDAIARLEEVEVALRDARGLKGELGSLLSPEEASATLHRVEALLEAGTFPEPDSEYRLPWPLV
ncbi:MAG: SCO1664 family protein [Actinomycetota bacterium]|nr:SCO1664 family protein [Actinomycetota bacterium]